eukprot:gene11988-14002_t
MQSSTIIITIFSILLIASLSLATDPSINYLGAGDPGVSYFPVFQNLKMHVRCYANVTGANANGPVAIFDSGLPFFSTVYSSVIIELLPRMPALNISRACFFDRYGYGWSDSAPYPFSASEAVFRIRESLLVASINGPYILAGWSWGGLDMQLFATQYPEQTLGLLTIDGTDVGYAVDPINPGIISYFTSLIENFLVINPSGGVKTLADAGQLILDYGYIGNTVNLPANAIAASQAAYLTDKYLTTIYQELQIMIPSAIILNDTYNSIDSTHPLGNLPFVVLTANTTSSGPGWNARQEVMSHLSTDSTQVYKQNGSHFIPIDDPALVVDSLAMLIGKIHASPRLLSTARSLNCLAKAVKCITVNTD